MQRLSAVVALLIAPLLLGTKPCPPEPCSSVESHWTFDRAICDKKADWIAVGRITNVVHHREPYPLLKDFATFTFVVDHWVKGGEHLPSSIPFQVGWCTNSQPLGESTNGTFIFWGRNKPDLEGAEWEYFHFEEKHEP